MCLNRKACLWKQRTHKVTIIGDISLNNSLLEKKKKKQKITAKLLRYLDPVPDKIQVPLFITTYILRSLFIYCCVRS